jgi:hypothetical protein
MNETEEETGHDLECRPVLVGLEETPEIGDAWCNLFAACWEAWEVIQQRRRAAAQASAAAMATVTEQVAPQRTG